MTTGKGWGYLAQVAFHHERGHQKFHFPSVTQWVFRGNSDLTWGFPSGAAALGQKSVLQYDMRRLAKGAAFGPNHLQVGYALKLSTTG